MLLLYNRLLVRLFIKNFTFIISIDYIIKLLLCMSISSDQIIELIPLIGHFPRLRKSHKLRFIERRGLIGAS